MDRYIIHGGTTLNGEVEISGAKNAAVAIIPAALLVQGVCRIENIPQISDTDTLLTILAELGARVSYLNKSTIEIDCTNARYQDAPYDLMRKIRASYYLIGSMLGRFGSAKTTMPGGVRPIDQHIKGMRALGAEINVRGGYVYADAKDGRLHGARIYLDKVSVGATMNIMIAGVLAEGRTVIENAAREPHIVDLANFLNSMGAGRPRRGHGYHQDQRCRRPARGHLYHHSRPDRGRHLYGRCGRHRRGSAGDQHHPEAYGGHQRQAARGRRLR